MPYRPGAQGPLQAALVKPVWEPNVPPGQSVHVAWEPVEYLPVGQMAGADVPPGHAYPTGHGPVHATEVAAALPKVPGGHGVHVTADGPLYWPAEH